MVTAENRFVRKTIEKALQDLPALPGVVMRVLEETEKPDASAMNIEKLICSDQALASKVLRVVNSAYYGLSGQVTSVSQAIVILGMQQVRNLVLSVSCVNAMKARSPKETEKLKAIWLQSFGSAAATQLIGRKKRIDTRDIEVLFIAGLLHDIGKLFLYSNFARTYENVLSYTSKCSMSLLEAEEKLMGMTHSEIGAQLARNWQLPDVLCSLIGEHDGPFEELKPLHYVLHLSSRILNRSEEEAATEPVDLQAVQWLGFGDAEMQWLEQETNMKMEEASQLFGLLAA